MPRVKTIRPGRLTGATEFTKQAATLAGAQKDLEFAQSLAQYNEEKQKLEDLLKEEQDTQKTYIDKITKMEQGGSTNLDASVKNELRSQAGEYAKLASDIKLGKIDASEGYEKLAKYDLMLGQLEESAPNFIALNKKIQQSKKLNEGEEGRAILGKGSVDVMLLVDKMFSPDSGEVEFFTKDGKGYYKDKTNENFTVSVSEINNIMKGENADYPLEFVEDPDKEIEAIYNASWGDGKNFELVEEIRDERTNKVTDTKRVGYDYDRYSQILENTAAVDNMIADTNQMRKYWPSLSGSEDELWVGSDEQKKIAKEAIIKRVKDKVPQLGDDKDWKKGYVVKSRKTTYKKPEKTTGTSAETEDSTVDSDGFDNSPTGYVDRTNSDIYGTLVTQSKTDPNVPNKLKGVTTINEDAMGSILDRELSSVQGYNVDSYEFVTDKSGNSNLVIKSVTPSGGKVYSKEQIKQLNDLVFEASQGDVSTIIGPDGTIVDKENFDALQLAETLDGNKDIFVPKGGSKKKESKEFVVKKLNTPDGVYELEKILITNRFTTAKEKQAALNKADKIRIDENNKILSGERKQIDAQKVRSNLKAIKNDFITVQNDKNPVVLNSPRGSFQTNAVNWFKSLPKDYKVRTPDGIVTAEEFLSKGSYPMNFLYETYTYTFEDAAKNPQPGISLDYKPMNINENSEGELD
jgi:hypothetical protein